MTDNQLKDLILHHADPYGFLHTMISRGTRVKYFEKDSNSLQKVSYKEQESYVSRFRAEGFKDHANRKALIRMLNETISNGLLFSYSNVGTDGLPNVKDLNGIFRPMFQGVLALQPPFTDTHQINYTWSTLPDNGKDWIVVCNEQGYHYAKKNGLTMLDKLCAFQNVTYEYPDKSVYFFIKPSDWIFYINLDYELEDIYNDQGKIEDAKCMNAYVALFHTKPFKVFV